jgi:hypothetical protein
MVDFVQLLKIHVHNFLYCGWIIIEVYFHVGQMGTLFIFFDLKSRYVYVWNVDKIIELSPQTPVDQIMPIKFQVGNINEISLIFQAYEF